MKTIIIEPGWPIPARYMNAEVDRFSFSAIPAADALPCPVCLAYGHKHTWQVTERGRVRDCSEAVAG